MTDARARIRRQALSLPGAWADMPWEDDEVVKVGKKVFVFLGVAKSDAPRITVKLTGSLDEALNFPSVAPAGYGLGRSGWVLVELTNAVPMDLLLDWVVESYRAVAPKKLTAQLESVKADSSGPG